MRFSKKVRLENVCKNYGKATVLKNININIERGERVIFLGPSGSGKTTLLKIIAGLESISKGNIFFDDSLVNNLSPSERNISMVFQNYGLYPHMTARENITFGLKMRKLPPETIRQRLESVANMLGLDNLLERLPRELSGGQQQRVALARAIVKEAPLFLLDEPLSNLDAQLRSMARVELVNIHKKIESTMIYVTHDQTEAMTIGQKIIVFSDGQVQQVGSPLEIYHRPINLFVAKFIGNPPMNLIPIRIIGKEILFSNLKLEIPYEIKNRIDWSNIYNAKTLGIRPEDIHLATEKTYQSIPAKLLMKENLGHESIYYFRVGEDIELVSKGKSNIGIVDGEILKLKLNWENIVFFDESGHLINDVITDNKILVCC